MRSRKRCWAASSQRHVGLVEARRVAVDGGERRAQLVADARQERPLVVAASAAGASASWLAASSASRSMARRTERAASSSRSRVSPVIRDGSSHQAASTPRPSGSVERRGHDVGGRRAGPGRARLGPSSTAWRRGAAPPAIAARGRRRPPCAARAAARRALARCRRRARRTGPTASAPQARGRAPAGRSRARRAACSGPARVSSTPRSVSRMLVAAADLVEQPLALDGGGGVPGVERHQLELLGLQPALGRRPAGDHAEHAVGAEDRHGPGRRPRRRRGAASARPARTPRRRGGRRRPRSGRAAAASPTGPPAGAEAQPVGHRQQRLGQADRGRAGRASAGAVRRRRRRAGGRRPAAGRARWRWPRRSAGSDADGATSDSWSTRLCSRCSCLRAVESVSHAGHQVDDVVGVDLERGHVGDQPAVAQHEDAVGEVEDLLHAVRDEQQAHARRAGAGAAARRRAGSP